jgi:flagellar motility protein MotE (MotC chaperone)
MNKILQSPWTGGAIGMILFLLIMVFAMSKVKVAPKHSESALAEETMTAWTFKNPEVDLLIEELRAKKAELDKRETDLNLLATRLQSEREQINIVTQSVARIQQQFDSNILHIQEAEMGNLKKLAKTYTGMESEEVARVFKPMGEDAVAKVLRLMKEDKVAEIIKAMSKPTEADAKRAASIMDRIRLSVVSPTTPTNTAAASENAPAKTP